VPEEEKEIDDDSSRSPTASSSDLQKYDDDDRDYGDNSKPSTASIKSSSSLKVPSWKTPDPRPPFPPRFAHVE